MIVWLASYPRSGNTFFRVLLNSVFDIKTHSLYGDVNDIASDEKTANVVGHEMLPEDFDIEQLRNSDKVYYIKTHGRSDILDGNDKVIYLVRDGRESALSYMNYLNNYGNKKTSLDDIISGDVLFGGWGDHVVDWARISSDSKLTIKFEELVSEPESHVKCISDFLGIDVNGSMPPTFGELHKINPKFFNKGNTKSWQSIYSEGQILYFNLKYYQSLYLNGYDVAGISEAGLVDEKGIVEILTYFESRLRDYASLEEANASLEGANASLVGANASLVGANASLVGANASLEEANASLEEANASLEGANASLEEANASLEGANASLDEVNANLERKIENQRDNLDKLAMLHKDVSEVFSARLTKTPMRKLQMYKELGQNLNDRKYT